jgi:hypothetical protein
LTFDVRTYRDLPLDLLPLSRQLYPLLRPLYWRNLELKIAPTFPIEQIGKLLEAQPNIRDLIQVISLEDVSRVPDYEGFQHDLGKIFRLCNCKALSYKWLGEVRIVNTYLQSGGRLVSLRIQLEGTEFPWGGTTGPAFDYWCELLCAVLPQLESLHLSNLELSAASSGEILGSIGGIEDAIVQFPECHRLKELEFGWHHGSCPLPLLKHILKSASRSLQRVSFVESALGIDQLQTAFDANNLSALKSLELKLRGKEPATIVALLQQVSVACPLLQHAFIVTTIHVRCRLVHDSSRLLEAIFLAPSTCSAQDEPFRHGRCTRSCGRCSQALGKIRQLGVPA